MNPTFNWLLFAAFALAGAALSTFVVLNYRRSKPATKAPEEILLPCAGPIARLDFEQSLDPRLFAKATEDESLALAAIHFGDLIGRGVPVTLESLKLWLANGNLLVGASPEAVKTLRAGTAYLQRHIETGRLLGHVADRKSGKIIEVMREISPGRKLLVGGAAVASLAVSISHMIATADLAKSLKLVDQKLDLLLAFRRIDQEAKLERIYSSAKELLSAPLDQHSRMELWRLRGELRELRAVWRRELEHHLKQIENPADEAWLNRMFAWLNDPDQQLRGKISGGTVQLAVLEYSLRVDRVLAAASDTWMISEATTLDELSALERVGVLLKEKTTYISPANRGSVQPMIDGIVSLVSYHRDLISAQKSLITKTEERVN